MIDAQRTADILRLHLVEKWPIGTISAQLGVHHDTVERVLCQSGQGPVCRVRARKIDPFLPFVRDTLERYPTLCASRLHTMLVARGYTGKPDAFRKLVACLRPRRPTEAFLRRRTLPGEEAQVDWAHFGALRVGRALRTLYGFVMVLSYSRAVFLHFSLHSAMPAFLRGHVLAFAYFQGVARKHLYDNLKSVVLERVGDQIRYHPRTLDLAAHYHFEPLPCAPRKGNEKGRVERAIRYIRDNFFAARDFRDLDDLNAQAMAWCVGPALARRVPDEPSLTVGEALAVERPKLLALPQTPFEHEEQRLVHVGKTPYVRFDLNDYSLPHTHVGRTLLLTASESRVRVLDGTRTLCEHVRSYDRDQRFEQPEHVAALREHKRKARHGQGLDRLYALLPSSRQLFTRLAEQGGNLGAMTSTLLHWLPLHGPPLLERVVSEALRLERLQVRALHHLLDKELRAQGLPIVSDLVVTDDPRLRHQLIEPHPLSSYDQLTPRGTDS